jgi:hypothetical protein
MAVRRKNAKAGLELADLDPGHARKTRGPKVSQV